MSKSLLSISQLTNVAQASIPGYFVASTAPINVEGDNPTAHRQQIHSCQPAAPQQEEQSLNEIAEGLFNKVVDPSRSQGDIVELIISVNGFSNSVKATRSRVEEIYNYINNDKSQQVQKKAHNLMYIGYRWPSEPLVGDNSWWFEKAYNALTSLPLLPRFILFFGLVSILLSLCFDSHDLLINPFLSFLFSIIILILTTMFFFVVSLVILRLAMYFRDSYRATNYGVPDLVELIRQLDKTLVNHVKKRYLDEVSLVAKFKGMLLNGLKDELSLEELVVAKQEEPVLEEICELIVNNYCIDRDIHPLKREDLKNKSLNSFLTQDYLDKVVKIAENLIKLTTDSELTRVKERAIEILENKAKKYWKDNNRIKLTFIGHSMGAYVVTSAVRILSDVFDLNSVGNLGATNKLPTSDIGSVFALERLVLVAPDIPVNTILSGRSNFLRSSLRRFSETYLFTNEGDLALRIASTVANYFSFPARTRESGYRLGNVAIQDNEGYGIINLNYIRQQQHRDLLHTLFIDSFNPSKSLAKVQEGFHLEEVLDREEIASLFTYFDCTDYTDQTTRNSKKRQVLTIGRWRWEPQWIYYVRLSIAYALGIKDTHGGYFQGQFSQQAIYRLAFLGFGDFLDSLNQKDRMSALDYLSQKCYQNKVQVILSPERYEVDILGRGRARVRREMLKA